jgi:hypothetical protein
MKKFFLAVMLRSTFGVANASADFLGIGIRKVWENVKRETTKACHDIEKTIGKVRRENLLTLRIPTQVQS